MAYGSSYTAVALTTGIIHVYFQESLQLKTSLNHGARVNLLMFSVQDRYLAASGQRKITLWDPVEEGLLWTVETTHQVLNLSFLDVKCEVSAVTQGNSVINWDLCSGEEVCQWQYNDNVRTRKLAPNTTRSLQPGKAIFSPDYTHLVVYYRGMPLQLLHTIDQRHLGTFDRESQHMSNGKINHYVVDALAFNPSTEINMLMVSYGDGELVIYDLASKQPQYRRPNVFAHTLRCSPNGRTLITGSAQGTIRIFEFAGARGDRLSPLFTINAQDDAIRDVAFSMDSLRFADVHGSQFRVWEPTILAYNDNEEGSQSDFSSPVSLPMAYFTAADTPVHSEITALYDHPGGALVFCGRRNGSINYVETATTASSDVLCRHASQASITCIDFIEHGQLLVTCDESGRILISKLKVFGTGFVFDQAISEIRSEQSVSRLLHDGSGTSILVHGRETMDIWNTSGQCLGKSPWDGAHETLVFNHPLQPEFVIAITQDKIHTVSWKTGLCLSTSNAQESGNSLKDTPPPLTLTKTVLIPKELEWCEERWNEPLILYAVKNVSNSPVEALGHPLIHVWPMCEISSPGNIPKCIPLNNFLPYSKRIQQIICIAESLLIFLDTDLWICSLDLSNAEAIAIGVRRHFFLLSEWRSADGVFNIRYIPATREFVVAKKHELLVICHGLNLEEPWIKDPYLKQ